MQVTRKGPNPPKATPDAQPMSQTPKPLNRKQRRSEEGKKIAEDIEQKRQAELKNDESNT